MPRGHPKIPKPSQLIESNCQNCGQAIKGYVHEALKYCGQTCYWQHKYRDRDGYLWARVDKNGPNGCWIYKGAADRRGYGRPARRGKRYYAHRRSYEIHKGPIPPGMLVLHKCDNPPCCNPEHLFLGTDADNAADAVSKLRHSWGERNSKAKLTGDQVVEIRTLRDAGTQREIAERYGVSQTAIAAILKGRSWRHL